MNLLIVLTQTFLNKRTAGPTAAPCFSPTHFLAPFIPSQLACCFPRFLRAALVKRSRSASLHVGGGWWSARGVMGGTGRQLAAMGMGTRASTGSPRGSSSPGQAQLWGGGHRGSVLQWATVVHGWTGGCATGRGEGSLGKSCERGRASRGYPRPGIAASGHRRLLYPHHQSPGPHHGSAGGDWPRRRSCGLGVRKASRSFSRG